MDRRFTVDERQIVHEALEDEVVIVNLDSGHYYMLEGTAPVIWQLLAGGASVEEVVQALGRRHPGDEERIGEAVVGFVDQLSGEGLLTAADGTGTARDVWTAAAEPAGPFTLPVMYRYTDMATLIQMDPIRDFDETGWPRRRTPPTR